MSNGDRLRTSVAAAGLAIICLGAGAAPRPRILTFLQRVAAQQAIERVYYAHQIGATRLFEEAVRREVIRQKVRRYLERSHDLQRARSPRIWDRMLDEELARITARTKLPDRLQEIFHALGDDPLLIREAFVSPVLVDRLWEDHLKNREYLEGGRRGPQERPAWVSSPGSGPFSTARLMADDSEPPPREPIAVGSTQPWCPGEADSWTPTSTDSAPAGRNGHTIIWTGNQMIVWGGYNADIHGIIRVIDTGGRYDPLTDTWTPTSLLGAPSRRAGHTAVWTGTHMVIWGGADENGDYMLDTGGRYDPVSDTWAPTSTLGAPAGRSGHTAVWTGDEMIVWGGADFMFFYNRGGRYDPVADTWLSTSTINAPRHRTNHTGIWTGTEMVIWGGAVSGPFTSTGARYDPGSDTWTPTSETGAPAGRDAHTAVWTGHEMLVWGGRDTDNPSPTYFNNGGLYDLATNVWSPISASGAPSGRWLHGAAWTGNEMIVWGGRDGATTFDSGGRYDPVSDSWSPTAALGAPSPRARLWAVWTGRHMIVWGGGSSFDSTGGLYFPGSDLPPEVTNLRWMDGGTTIEWDACPGGVANYDVFCGDLGGVGAIGNGSSEVCMANEHPDTQMPDLSPEPAPGHGLYFLVRATTPYSMGSYGRGTSGQERTTAACP